ncbi:unnamed protein product [Mytilus coruscus]|uniref:Uncharacterized protein n=1 Tax=Mytilus coruscus TaxID=42192 RepID=A0A6J8CF02_MYTCO|nr:unnamed protein product [Mytilus coruscus]
MDKATWQKFQPAMDSFCRYLLQTHPNDNQIPQYLKQINDIVTNKQLNADEKERKKEDQKIKLKREIMKSYCEIDENRENAEVALKQENEKECLKTLKALQNKIDIDKRRVLKFGSQQGRLINKLTQNLRLKGVEICTYLASNGIVFSLSHCYALMDLWRMTSKYPKLLKCSMNLRDITRNIKLVDEICIELGW